MGGGWNERAFAREIRTGSLPVVVLRAAHGSVETRGIAAYCASRVVADEMEVLSMAVRPEWRRQGLARGLLRLALNLGTRKGALSAFLEVRSGNGPARQLYASLGFEETGRRHGYYKDPAEDAIVLFRPCGPGAFNS